MTFSVFNFGSRYIAEGCIMTSGAGFSMVDLSKKLQMDCIMGWINNSKKKLSD